MVFSWLDTSVIDAKVCPELQCCFDNITSVAYVLVDTVSSPEISFKALGFFDEGFSIDLLVSCIKEPDFSFFHKVKCFNKGKLYPSIIKKMSKSALVVELPSIIGIFSHDPSFFEHEGINQDFVLLFLKGSLRNRLNNFFFFGRSLFFGCFFLCCHCCTRTPLI